TAIGCTTGVMFLLLAGPKSWVLPLALTTTVLVCTRRPRNDHTSLPAAGSVRMRGKHCCRRSARSWRKFLAPESPDRLKLATDATRHTAGFGWYFLFRVSLHFPHSHRAQGIVPQPLEQAMALFGHFHDQFGTGVLA